MTLPMQDTLNRKMQMRVSSAQTPGILGQLALYHRRVDPFQGTAMTSPEQIKRYFSYVMQRKRLLYCLSEDNIVVGYVESWRITFEQFGRILCKVPFPIDLEDIEMGPLCYIANTTILGEYLQSSVYKLLRNELFRRNADASHFVGQAIRKCAGLVKVFKASEIHYAQDAERGLLEDATATSGR